MGQLRGQRRRDGEAGLTAARRGWATIAGGCGTLILAALLIDGAASDHGFPRWLGVIGALAALLAGAGEIRIGIAALRRRG